jgi:transcriptional regulator with XRE-family HTH domain
MEFSSWLLEEMNKRGWSQSELARAAGLNRQSISDYVTQRRIKPDPDALVSLAHGLSISPVTVFRKAGLLPEGGDDKVQFDDWEYLLRQLSPEDQDEMRQLALLKIERHNREKQVKALKTKKA